ncbi:hypothetical protein GQ43DRAFT_428313 [Delitschia confertaspora ATCC 74209]|uniref:Vacuolar protein sorting-associated protein 62 n=1 Tax=Delitschia confertaspora ATCC 74209 TaxID=1513339 RepID=A0A9P4JTW4_9PLEO|nr:hypothetical protein GQ43DRAFT_428313 [Delitschia confertaspora ATCC 74209]
MKGRKGPLAILGAFLGLFTFSELYQNVLFPGITPVSERAEESSWVASSDSWLDRKVCNWFGFCGLAHLNKAGWTSSKSQGGHRKQHPLEEHNTDGYNRTLNDYWTSAKTSPEDWSDDERRLREIPQYALEYAPYIHLYSGEEFWPCDMAEHLIHTTPHLNYTPIQASSDHPNLTHLDDLNKYGRFLYLQSDDNVEDRPKWLGGERNIPQQPDQSDDSEASKPDEYDQGTKNASDDGREKWTEADISDTVDKGGSRPVFGAPTASVPIPTDTREREELVGSDRKSKPVPRDLGKQVKGGKSSAPAVLIVIDKGDGVVDAFWFFFYSYNLGNKVFNVRFGNHVGDWEHTVVRFHRGEPKQVWFSEHNFGQTYTYEAVEKIGKRPLGYVATGTHAMYATAGTHPYILPGGVLHDVTDRGPLWDPSLNVHSFTYDYINDTLRSSTLTPYAPVGWFYYTGHWGDKFYPLSDPRQYRFVGQYHYVNGPLGPRYKNLGREKLCQGNSQCQINHYMGPKRSDRRLKRYEGVGEGEEMNEEDVRRFFGPEHDLQ